jgi:ornithine cyclodeaminase/alanine dehydrogenase
MIAARETGVAFKHKLVALTEVLQGQCTVAQRPDNIVMFKSVGSGLQDIAVSEMCYAKACATDAGTILPIARKRHNDQPK